MQEQKVFKTGVFPDPLDTRDYIYEDMCGAEEHFDWNKGYDVEAEMSQHMGRPMKLKVESQNGSLSCVGQATAKYVEVLSVFDEKFLPDLSAKDVYQAIHLPGGTAIIRDAMKFVVDNGVDHEASVPSYQNGQAPSEAFMQAKVPRNAEQAKRFKALSYLRTTHNDIDFMAAMIRDNHGLVSSYQGDSVNWSAKFMTPPKKPTYSHAVYFGKAKMINGKKYLGLLNSGGTKVGDQGWQWMGEDYFGHLGDSIWVLKDFIINGENMIVDKIKLEQIYQEILARGLKPEENEAEKSGYLGLEEGFVRAAVGKSPERQRLIRIMEAVRS